MSKKRHRFREKWKEEKLVTKNVQNQIELKIRMLLEKCLFSKFIFIFIFNLCFYQNLSKSARSRTGNFKYGKLRNFT